MGIYSEGWSEYRVLRRRVGWVFLGFTPATFIVAELSNCLFHTFLPAMIFAVFWMIAYGVVSVQFAQFSCPRCGEAFASPPGYFRVKLGMFARTCWNCGLEKFEGE